MNPKPCLRSPRYLHATSLSLSAFLALLPLQLARAASGTWNADASGSWTSGLATNWAVSAAEGEDSTAFFNAVNITSNRTVTLTANLTIGNLAFGDATTASNDWTLAASGGAVLTLQTTTGTPTITVDNRTATITAGLAGTQGLIKDGAGKLVLNGVHSSLAGTLTVNTGTLDLWSTTSDWSNNINLVATSSVLDAASTVSSSVITVTGDITGLGKINKTSSSSALVLAGNNTFSGGTTLTDGRLILGSGTNNGLGTGAFAINGGALQSLDNNSRTIANTISVGSNSTSFGAIQGSTTGLGDLIFTATGTLGLGGSKTWTVTNATTVSFANGWSGSQNVTKAGTGTLLFNANSTYTGVTRVNGGVLGVKTLANGGANSGIGAATTAATNLVLAGGTLRFMGDTSGSTNRLFSLAYGANGSSSVLDASGSVPMQFTGTGDIGIATGSASTPFSSSLPIGTTTFTLNDVSNVLVGMGVTGSNVAAGTYITAVNTTTKQVTLSQGSTSAITNSTANFTLYGGPRVLTLTGNNTGANLLAANLTDSAPNNGSQASLSHVASLVKDGAGKWTLTGTNTYTGTTTINAGTLALGANNVFADASNFAMGAGTLEVGTFSDTVGTLSLTGNASITLGSGGSLVFADSHLATWGANTLSITGTFVDGSSIRFGTDGTGLTSGQLALITINGGAASIDSSGFLVSAIPEPSSAALIGGALSLGLVLMQRRKRR